MSKYYLAYGSNLSVAQMAQRCPDAVYVGTAVLTDYRLLFKGSQWKLPHGRAEKGIYGSLAGLEDQRTG